MLQFLFVFALAISTCSAKFPQAIPQCKVGNTDCIKDTTNIILKNFYAGEPKISLSQLDPLKISRMQIKQGGESPVNIELNFNNVELSGLKDFVVTSVKGFTENPVGHYEMKLKGPKLELKGPYTIAGRILVLPVQGAGQCTFVLENPELYVRWNGKTKEKDGKTHLYTDDLRLTFKISRMHANFGNLFNGERNLGETTNRFMNENWQDIFNEIKGSIFDAFSLITQQHVNNMWAHHDYRNLFLQ